MTKIKEKTGKYKGHNILVSFVKVSSMLYEVGVFDLDADFKELDMYSNLGLDSAEFYYEKMLKKYLSPKKSLKEQNKIPKRYTDFAVVYLQVYEECKQRFMGASFENDGGTSNFDTPIVSIGSRVSENLLKAALKPYDLKFHLDKNIIFCSVPYSQFQGSLRTEQARCMASLFESKGYNSSVHYRID